jgi:hypothetical protein
MNPARFSTPAVSGIALAAFLIAAPASAVDRYVSPSGSGTACSAGSPCALTTANSQAVAGDVVRMRAGNYGTADINPANNGTSGARITYRPDTLGNPVHVDQVILATGRSYITIRNVNATSTAQKLSVGAGTGSNGVGDSLVNITARGLATISRLTNAVIYNCDVGDTTVSPGNAEYVVTNAWNTVTFRRSRFHVRSNNAATVRMWYPHDWTNSTFDSNSVIFVYKSGSEQGAMFSNCNGNRHKDNHWRIYDYGFSNGIGLGYRDGSIGNFSVVRDTFTEVGPAAVSFLRGSGNVPANNMAWAYCIFRQSLPVMPANGSSNWSFDHCQIAINNRRGSNPSMFQPLNGNLGGLSLTHCSLLYYSGANNSTGGEIFADQVDLGSATIRDNVIARMQSQNSSGCPSIAVTSVNSSAGTAGRWNRNVYWLYNKHSATVDSANGISNGSCSKPGANPACGTWGVDCNGRWGGSSASQIYADTTWNPRLGLPDLTPSNTGLISHAMWPDGYVGARSASGQVQVDVIPPAAIQNLGTGGAAAPPTSPSSMVPDDPKGGDEGDPETPVPPRAPGLETGAPAPAEPASRPWSRPAPWSPRHHR